MSRLATRESQQLPADARESRVVAAPGSLEPIAQACLADALEAFGLAGVRAGLARRLLGYALAPPVQRLAREMLVFDEIVAAAGLQQGARHALAGLVRGVAVQGLANVPRNGPLLVVANHPGLADAVALFAHLPRADLRVIAAHRRLLSALPATAAYLMLVPESARSRLPVLREAIVHLCRGGTVLMFPAGRIEPDPVRRPEAVAALDGWSAGINMFARCVPELAILPAAIHGVLSDAAVRHPLTRLRRKNRDRDWLAAMLQMLDPRLRDVTTRLVFDTPIRPGDGVDMTPSARVRQRMQYLLSADRRAG